MHPPSDVYYTKPMLLPHEGWPMAAGPVSRPGSSAREQNRAAALTHTRTRTCPHVGSGFLGLAMTPLYMFLVDSLRLS